MRGEMRRSDKGSRSRSEASEVACEGVGHDRERLIVDTPGRVEAGASLEISLDVA
jgi:hypothetical protein